MISKHELDEIVAHGATMIHLTQPVRDQDNNNISWSIATPGVLNTDGETFLQKSAIFVMTYDQLQHDPKLTFLGSYYSEHPAPDDWILLALVMQREEHSTGVEDGCIDVGQVYSQCFASKPNIAEGRSLSHHSSCSGIYGFGAR